MLGSDELIDHQNQLVSFKGMTVEAAGKDADGKDVAFLYNWMAPVPTVMTYTSTFPTMAKLIPLLLSPICVTTAPTFTRQLLP